MSQPMTTVVIDAGSGLVKAGIAGHDAPSVAFLLFATQGTKARFIGHEATAKKGILSFRHPIEHGVITDWDHMESIWDFTFRHLRLDPTSHPILLTESPRNPKSYREKSMEIMFETFHAPAVYVQLTAVLALYASGRTTGLVVESGDGVTYAVPIYEGFGVRKTTLRMDVGGRDLTQVLQRELKANESPLESSAEFGIVQDIKERLCYVALNYEEECRKPLREIGEYYVLPDGNHINVGHARFKAAEAMFNPRSMLEMEDDYGGVCGLAARSINTSEIDLRAALAQNIVLAGGNTMTANFPERFALEIQAMLSSDAKVYASSERKYLAWIGGSMLGSLSSFNSMAVTKEEYESEGAAAIHRKCF